MKRLKTALTYVDVPIVAYGVLFRSARRPSRGGEAHEEKEKEKRLLSTARSNSSRRSASGAQGARGVQTQAGEQLESHLTWKKRDEEHVQFESLERWYKITQFESVGHKMTDCSWEFSSWCC